jgi:hypothetical protein
MSLPSGQPVPDPDSHLSAGNLSAILALGVEATKCRFQSKRAQIYIRSQLFPSTFKYIAALNDFNVHA